MTVVDDVLTDREFPISFLFLIHAKGNTIASDITNYKKHGTTWKCRKI